VRNIDRELSSLEPPKAVGLSRGCFSEDQEFAALDFSGTIRVLDGKYGEELWKSKWELGDQYNS